VKIPRQIFYSILATLILLTIELSSLALAIGIAIASSGKSFGTGLLDLWNPRHWS